MLPSGEFKCTIILTTSLVVSSARHKALYGLLFFIGCFMEPKLRTCVYIDGFNLYYGLLKNTPYKWLDLKKLFNTLLSKHNEIISIKYYTARISSRDNDIDAPNRQKAYLSALEKYSPEIEIYYGHYLSHNVKAKVYQPPRGCPEFVKVIKTEEKGSDVNMALHILNDAWLNKYDCAVLVSNDSDISEALKLVKTERNKTIGIIPPINNKHRRPSRELMKYQDFTKQIRTSALAQSQLPSPIPGTTIFKPSSW